MLRASFVYLTGHLKGRFKFHRPEDPEAFEAPWRWHVGVISGSMNYIVDEDEVVRTTREQLLDELESRSAKPTNG